MKLPSSLNWTLLQTSSLPTQLKQWPDLSLFFELIFWRIYKWQFTQSARIRHQNPWWCSLSHFHYDSGPVWISPLRDLKMDACHNTSGQHAIFFMLMSADTGTEIHTGIPQWVSTGVLFLLLRIMRLWRTVQMWTSKTHCLIIKHYTPQLSFNKGNSHKLPQIKFRKKNILV